jgi:N-acetylneuraminate synthase
MTSTTHVYIIAEAGVNHNGSLDLAKGLIEAAASAGVDAVKFQTFRAEKVVCRSAPKANYQVETGPAEESQFDMLRKLELDADTHQQLAQKCQKCGVDFLSTPFDLESLDLLVNAFNLPRIKLSSGDITNAPLLLQSAQLAKPVLLSTGMSTLSDVEAALGVLAHGYIWPKETPSAEKFRQAFVSECGQQALRKNVTLLHCTSEYPAPFEDINLRAIETLSRTFGLPVGYSDHTIGIAVSIAAVACGATVIEKHFTLDRHLPGPDQESSVEPRELKVLVQSIREVEKALGSPRKSPSTLEMENRTVVRRSLVAACKIKRGERFTGNNLTAKRPGTGISPIEYWDWIGQVAQRNYKRDEMILRWVSQSS